MTSNRDQLRAHLDDGDIAAYIDGVMTESELRSAEAHLAACDECRREATASQDVVSSAPSPRAARPRSRARWIGAAAAAAMMIVAVSTLTRTTSIADKERSATDGVPNTQRVVPIVGPVDGTPLGNDRRLVWRAEASGATYRITVGDDSGQPIHSATLADTSLVIPQSVGLTPGRKYFWYVDAMADDGSTATSGLNSFTVD